MPNTINLIWENEKQIPISFAFFCTYSFSQVLNSENEKSLSPQIKYQGVSEIDDFPKTNDEIKTFQKDISSSVKSLDTVKSLTKDYFSNLGSKTEKQRFETYTENKGLDTEVISGELENKNNVSITTKNKEIGVERGKNYDSNSSSSVEDTNIIFYALGLTFLGLVTRSVLKDKTIAKKPRNTYSLIIQLIISIIVGACVYFLIIPKSWKRESDIDIIDAIILK